MCEPKFTPDKGWLMARTARQMPPRLSLFEFGALIPIAAQWSRGTFGGWPICRDNLMVRALGASGLAALTGLPILMIASIMLDAPLAMPAGLALGYLATSYALASRLRCATAINAFVLVGLVIWLMSFLLAGGELSRTGLAAALLAPAFAVAPALARIVTAPGIDAASRIALKSTACLDQLAPNETVLVVRRDGTLLAATRAAEERLRLPTTARGNDVGRSFGLVDRPKLSGAIARCGPKKLEVTLQGENGREANELSCTAEILAIAGGAVSIRLGPTEPGSVPLAALDRADGLEPELAIRSGPNCDVGEAVAFALRCGEPAAKANQTAITFDVESGLSARCERQACRRILLLMIETSLMRSGAGDHLHLSGRKLRSVVLLRLVHRPAYGTELSAADKEENVKLTALRRIVEETGGTVVAECLTGEPHLSVRLNSGSDLLQTPRK